MSRKIRDCYNEISERIKEKTGWEPIEIVFLLGCLLSVLLMFARCFFGTEFSDEAFTVSDPLAVMHGNLPYVYNITSTSGQSFIPMVFYKIYEWLVPDMQGIFLYSRICYVLFRMLIILAIYVLLRNDIPRKWRLLCIGILIPFQGSVIQGFSYNSIPTYTTLLVAVMLYTVNRDSGLKAYLKLFFCGFLSAISVFAHPAHVFSVLIFAILIVVNSVQKNKLKRLLVYCMGGMLEILIVFVPIIAIAGFDKLTNGIDILLTCGQSELIKTTVLVRIKEVLRLVYPWWSLMLGIALFLYIVGKNYIRVKEQKLSNKQYWLLVVSVATIVCMCLCSKTEFFLESGVVCLGTFLLTALCYKRWNSLIWYIAPFNIVFIIFMTISTQTGVGRVYYSLPLIVCFIMLLFEADNALIKQMAIALCIITIVLQGYKDFRNTYRDEEITHLKTKVEEGVYKGIYTTETRAVDLVELERYLKNNIGEEESVSFRDNAPVGYLILNKNVCDIRTWDEMQWTYECDDPMSMYRYYQTKGEIPDVIAYIDFGRDKSMSIENTADVFHYNNFVNTYYYLDKNDFQNDTFRVWIFRNNGSFDYAWEKLLSWAE